MSRPLAVVAAAGFVVAAALVAAPARAESAVAPPRCGARILPQGGTGPVNLPAFVVDDTSSPGLVVTAAAPVITPSLDVDVVPDPRDPKVALWVPKAGTKLEIGVAHVFTFGLQCSDAPKSQPDHGSWTFEGTSAVALPTSIGTARELADGRTVITPSADLAPFMPVTHFEVSIDGKPVGTIRYGVVSGEPEVSLTRSYVRIGDGSTPRDGSVALCSGATTGIEKHGVTVLAHIAGAATDPPPLALSLSLDCAIAPSTVTLPDGGGDDRGASGGADGGSGGCAVSGGGPASGLVVFFGIGAALAASLRKRRQRRC